MRVCVRVDVRTHDLLVERVGEVEHVVRDAELRSDATRVLDIGDAAAARVARAAPELERHPGDVVTLVDQERGRDRRVDTPAHRNQHARHDAAQTVDAARRPATARGTTASAASMSAGTDA